MPPAKDFKRDRYNRPLVLPKGVQLDENGKGRKAYARASSLGGLLESSYNLTKWKQRMTAIGLADREDLLLAASAHREDKKELDDICEKAMEAAQAGANATKGTALHLLTEKVDRGERIPAIPAAYRADLDEYRRLTAGMTAVEIEKRVACDAAESAGTTDRIWDLDGTRYIGDVKTGSTIELGIVKIAVQFAIYSRSDGYDVDTDERDPLNVSQDWGLVLHLPSGQGAGKLYWIDLNKGWELALLAKQVKDAQGLKLKHLTHEIIMEAA